MTDERLMSSPPGRLFGGFALFGLLALWLHSAARSGEIGFNGSRGSASFHANLATQPEQFWGAIIFFSLLALAALTVGLLGLWDMVMGGRS